MTISSASKLVNFRVPALQNLIRRHLFRPSAASTNLVTDAHLVDPPCLVKEDFYPRFRSSFVTKNFDMNESNSSLCFNASFRFSVMQSEAARNLGEDAGSETGALVNGDACCHPRSRRASYDSDSDSDSDFNDSDEDADHRDSYDSDAPCGDSSDDGECFNENEGYTTYDEDYEGMPRNRAYSYGPYPPRPLFGSERHHV